MNQIPGRKPIPSRAASTAVHEALLVPEPESTTSAHRYSSPHPIGPPSSSLSDDTDTPVTDEAYRRRDHLSNIEEKSAKPIVSNVQPLAILTDIAVVLIPAFIGGFIIRVWNLNNDENVEDTMGTWQDAMTYLATAFPILFASVAGRLMSVAARWKLERGAEIGLLETLMGSRTVGSTITTLAQLRSFDLVTLGLIMLWAISPLGGQSFLRVLSVKLSIETTLINNVTYFDTTAAARVNWRFFDQDSFNQHKSLMSTIYRALIIGHQSSKAQSTDLWGNIKIPFIQQEDQDTEIADWNLIQDDSAIGNFDTPYASLLGVPFSLPPSGGNISFLMESSYVDLHCPVTETSSKNLWTYELRSYVEPALTPWILTNGTWWVPCVPSTNGTDDTPACDRASSQWGVALDRFVDKNTWTPGYERHIFSPNLFVNEDGIEAGETRLLFLSKHQALNSAGDYITESTASECDVTQRYVESRVNCTRSEQLGTSETGGNSNCRVVAQRPSQKKHASKHLSFLSFSEVFEVVAELMPSRRIPTEESTPFPDITAGYLSDPSRLIQPEAGASMVNVTSSQFSRRLTQLVNTFLGTTQLSLNATIGSIPATSWEPETVVTTAESRRFVEHIQVSKPWAITCLAATVVLTSCGIFSVILRHLGRGPEILGYVSSAIRDSKFIDIPDETRYLDGLELTKAIRKERLIWRAWGPAQAADDGEQDHRPGIVREQDKRHHGSVGQEEAA